MRRFLSNLRERKNRCLSPIFLIFLAGCQTVPFTGRSRVLLVSIEEEKALGAEAYQKVLREGRLSQDREKVLLLRKVGRRLAQVAERPDFQWEFNLLQDDKQVNAFCLPGGKVAFYTGILPVARDEAGIAVVMGHEIAHALARHGAERMSQGMLANLGGNVLGVLLSSKPAATREAFGQAYGLGLGVGVLLPHSRAHEAEADRIGLTLMAKAGYDPRQAVEFWKKMETLKGGSGGPGFLSTHPTDLNRQKKLAGWMPEALKFYESPAR